MTSNTIAYAQQQEDQRHNLAFEEETNRHNIVTEALDKEKLQIEDFRARAEAQYKQESNRIQEAYNQAYLSLQTAQGQRKLDIEEQLATLEERKTEITQQWYRDQADVNRRNAEVNEKKVEEDIRFHTLTTEQTERQIQLNKDRLRFDTYAFNESNLMRREELEASKAKVNIDADIRRAQTHIDEMRYSLEAQRQQKQLDLLDAETQLKQSQSTQALTNATYKPWELIYGLFGNVIRSIR